MTVAGTGYGGSFARLFQMTDDVWDRHASAWSVWTRFLSFPLIPLAIWSHVWFGWIGAAALFIVVAVWLWFNPRAFPPPASTDNWSAKATLGERVWINRKAVPIPRHHAIMAHMLSVVAGIGFLLALYGAFVTALWPVLLGTVLVYGGKLWFCDRMVWLYDDMKDLDPTYRSWLR